MSVPSLPAVSVRSDGNHLNRWLVYSHLRRNQILHNHAAFDIPYIDLATCSGEFYLVDVITDQYTAALEPRGVHAHVLMDMRDTSRINFVGYTYRPLWLPADLARRVRGSEGNVTFFAAAAPDPMRHSLVASGVHFLDGKTWSLRSKTHADKHITVTLRAFAIDITVTPHSGGSKTFPFEFVFPLVLAKPESRARGDNPVELARWPATLPAFFEEEGLGTAGADLPFYRLVKSSK